MTANKGKVAAAGAAAALAGIVLLFSQQYDRLVIPGAGHAPASADAASDTDKSGTPGTRTTGDTPLWRALTPAQQVALQPLRGEWDQMDGVRKQKWLQLANRFAGMKPEEQQRVHKRMREWVKLTPEQRELARETYARARKIAPARKSASWASYQQLPEEQKKKLAASGRKVPVAPSQASKAVAPLGRGAAACPIGTVRNTVSATPPCVPAPVTPTPAPVPALPLPKLPQQEKPVPANWGITPNNA